MILLVLAAAFAHPRTAPQRRSLASRFVMVAQLMLAAFAVAPPYTQCEFRDGDCPSPCPTGDGVFGATPTLRISAMCAAGLCSPGTAGREFGGNARAADAIIAAHANATDFVRFDNTTNGLHTSVLYMCCHTLAQQRAIGRALAALRWHSFDLNYTDVGCNVDMHGSDIVYLHAMPDAAGQAALQALTARMDAAFAAAGVPVVHPRGSKFHMTLARVTRSYPADDAVAALRAQGLRFGGLRACRFQAFGADFASVEGCPPPPRGG